MLHPLLCHLLLTVFLFSPFSPISCLGGKLQRLQWMLIMWERAESLQGGALRCGQDGNLLRKPKRSGMRKFCCVKLKQKPRLQVLCDSTASYKDTCKRITNTNRQNIWCSTSCEHQRGENWCRQEQKGRRIRDKRRRLWKCSEAPSDGVTWRTKQRGGNRLVTFNDVFSVEASLCLCSAPGRKEVHVSDVNTYKHTHSCIYTHSCHELKQIIKHAKHDLA